MTHSIFSPMKLGSMTLKNRLVMSPLTRCRAVEANTPNALMATYYAQRAGAGLIISEGTAPSPNGLGYARIPGIYNDAQVAGWAEITRQIHAAGGHLFIQLMHTGRVSHALNMPAGAEVIAPSAVRLEVGKMWTDQQQMQDYPTPRAMSTDEVQAAIGEFVNAAKNAVRAGADGVELHGANGYLIEQFLNPHINQRTDRYGGTVENRIRFALETAHAVVEAIGKEKVGIRLSPHGINGGMAAYPETDATYAALADALNKLGIVYIHVLDQAPMGVPLLPAATKAALRERFHGAYIAAGGLDLKKAQELLDNKEADLFAFGRGFLANPDLVEKFANGWPINPPKPPLFFSAGAEGYTDYPVHAG